MRGKRLRNRSGASLALVAVSLIGLLAVMSLAIDVGMMFSARTEAQRVADAAALAGASEFPDAALAGRNPSQTEAVRRAQEFVQANFVLATPVDSATEATILVDMAKQQVRVIVNRSQIKTWFARILGINVFNVVAAATAEYSNINSAGAECVLPWAMQDMWHELTPLGAERMAQNGDRWGDGDGDRYEAVPSTDAQLNHTATGYGAYNPPVHQAWVGNGHPDWGMQLVLKQQSPSGPQTALAQPGPGEFLILDVNDSIGATLDQCAMNGTSGNAAYANAICSSNPGHCFNVKLGVPYDLDYGNRVGPTRFGLEGQGHLPGVLGSDPGAYWNNGTVSGSSYANWMDSPRVRKIALMHPLPPPPGQNYTAANLRTVVFTNIAIVFIESFGNGSQPPVTARFLTYANAANVPGLGGPTMKRLRLIE